VDSIQHGYGLNDALIRLRWKGRKAWCIPIRSATSGSSTNGPTSMTARPGLRNGWNACANGSRKFSARIRSGRRRRTRGGHLRRDGRFWRPRLRLTTPAPDGHAGGSQIAADRLATDAGGFFDAPERPAQAPERQNLLLLLVIQDVAHANEDTGLVGVNVSVATWCDGRFSGVHQWPVLGVHRGAQRSA
jgi:hypothetical protein